VIPAPFVEPPAATGKTPRALALLASTYDYLGKAKCRDKRRDLESTAEALRGYTRRDEDISDDCEMDFCVRIARIVQRPDADVRIEEPEPMTDEEFSARCAVQPDVEAEDEPEVIYEATDGVRPTLHVTRTRMAEVANGETWDDEAAE
jgi:hypothetical protein